MVGKLLLKIVLIVFVVISSMVVSVIVFRDSFKTTSHQLYHKTTYPTIPQTTYPTIPPPKDMALLLKWEEFSKICRNRTLTIYVTVGHGSSALRCLFLTVLYAMKLNRSLIIAQPAPSDITWETIFEPISPNCSIPPSAIRRNRIEEIPGFRIIGSTNAVEYENIDDVWLDGSSCPIYSKVLPAQENIIEYMSKGVDLALRMKPEVFSVVEGVLSAFPDWNTRKYHSMHIRRGDKVFGSAAEARFKSTAEYCYRLEQLAGGPIVDPVFVAADSLMSIQDVMQHRTNWTVWYIDTPTFARLRQGNFTHAHFFLWPMDDRIYWYEMFLAELTMMRYASTFVGTRSSNVWQLVNTLRAGVKSISLD